MGGVVARMQPRRILFWMHLCAGVAAGVVILIMCVTGIGLAFERQINHMADQASRAAVERGPARLPIGKLVEQVPDGVRGLSAITIFADPKEPAAFAFGRERTLFIDPYNGRYLGEGSKTSREFFAWLERWHRALGAQLRGGGPGRPIAGAANLIFLVLVLTGPVLWWPRKTGRRQFRAITFFRRGLSGRAMWWNLHNVAGIWSTIPLFLIVLTGVIMSYTWANNLLFRAAGSQPPVRSAGPEQRRSPHARADLNALDMLFERAKSQVPGWQSVALRWPPAPAEAVFTIDRGNGGQPGKRAQLTLDAQTGALKRWEPFASYSTGRQWRAWARFLHTGELFGLSGQIVAALATLGGATLAITGLVMVWYRVRSAAARKRAQASSRVESSSVA
ncbi:MAG TPA: PepSY-associated TM helix domain-containing protein [Bryobacteraceae bacterium]